LGRGLLFASKLRPFWGVFLLLCVNIFGGVISLIVRGPLWLSPTVPLSLLRWYPEGPAKAEALCYDFLLFWTL
jgi:hypothetical protein